MSAAEVCYYGLVVLSALVLVVNLVVLACHVLQGPRRGPRLDRAGGREGRYRRLASKSDFSRRRWTAGSGAGRAP